MKIWIAIPIMAFLTGCATSAKPIPEHMPHALLKFGPATGVAGIGAYWFDNEKCEAGAYSGKVGVLSWMTGREAEITVPAGQAIYVAQHWASGSGAAAYSCGGPACVGLQQCNSMVQFTPVAGRTYEAQIEFLGNHCKTNIVDISNDRNELVQGQKPVPSCLHK